MATKTSRRHGLIGRTGIVWRYLPGSKVRHALPADSHQISGHGTETLCGLGAFRPQDWHGTGTQTEHETVEKLPECRRCATYLPDQK